MIFAIFVCLRGSLAHVTQSLLLRYSEFIGNGKKQKPKSSRRQDSDNESEEDDLEGGDDDDDEEEPGTMDIDQQIQPVEVRIKNLSEMDHRCPSCLPNLIISATCSWFYQMGRNLPTSNVEITRIFIDGPIFLMRHVYGCYLLGEEAFCTRETAGEDEETY